MRNTKHAALAAAMFGLAFAPAVANASSIKISGGGQYLNVEDLPPFSAPFVFGTPGAVGDFSLSFALPRDAISEGGFFGGDFRAFPVDSVNLSFDGAEAVILDPQVGLDDGGPGSSRPGRDSLFFSAFVSPDGINFSGFGAFFLLPTGVDVFDDLGGFPQTVPDFAESTNPLVGATFFGGSHQTFTGPTRGPGSVTVLIDDGGADAVVPEPTSLAITCFAGVALTGLRSRYAKTRQAPATSNQI